MSHTPGPWTYEEGTRGLHYVLAGRMEVCSLIGDGAKPDARLIAAAPDLLAMLKECLGYVTSDYELRDGSFGDAQDTVDNARAVIKRAEGK